MLVAVWTGRPSHVSFVAAPRVCSLVRYGTRVAERSQGAIFKNAVLTSTSFVGANVENADFTEVRGKLEGRCMETWTVHRVIVSSCPAAHCLAENTVHVANKNCSLTVRRRRNQGAPTLSTLECSCGSSYFAGFGCVGVASVVHDRSCVAAADGGYALVVRCSGDDVGISCFEIGHSTFVCSMALSRDAPSALSGLIACSDCWDTPLRRSCRGLCDQVV